MNADRQQPGRAAGRAGAAQLTQAQRELTTHRAAVRMNLGASSGDISHAARTLRHAIGVAEYAFLDVPSAVRAAADHLERWDAGVQRLLAAERAEREATGTTALAQQAAIEQAWYRRRAAWRAQPNPGMEGGHER
jgi:hypothetical protein